MKDRLSIKDTPRMYCELVCSKKSPLRVMMLTMFRKISKSILKDKEFEYVLDIGGKEGHAAINKKYIKHKYYYIANIDKSKGTDIVMDATKQYPFRKQSIDLIISFNLMEHLYDYETHIKESYNILKKKGIMLLYVPFSMYYHADPKDYWRFTKDALEELFMKYFNNVKIISVGYGPFLASAQYHHIIYNKIPIISYVIKILAYFFIIIIDTILRMLAKLGFSKSNLEEHYPSGYFVIAER